jgi:hypothetical protein
MPIEHFQKVTKEFEKVGASGKSGSADMKVLKLGRAW